MFGVQAERWRVVQENQSLVGENNGFADCDCGARVGSGCFDPFEWVREGGDEGREDQGGEDDGGKDEEEGAPKERAP